jgi:DNA-binding NtrC family response regulator
VLAATNKNPEQAVAGGQLRQDLYFRLNVFHIHLPPLREHKDDLGLLIEHLLAELSEKHGKKVTGVGADALDLLRSYPWPGNVRELRNVLERAVIASDRGTLGRQHLPPDFGHAPAILGSGLTGVRFPVGTTVDDAERELILQTLSATSQNKTRAAELLGISLKTLHNKLKEYEAGRSHASQPEN